ncbi:DNA-binding IclR family transcriptional regulator [Streptomyces aurantiacus]|uniref:IclR family transcriptional regulator n=1 Tax=Streptomyces aurantiacus TaxID=47760 RepID=UPI00279402B1|nr:helix-turn-helix domain-containing protein [Streptomyces aurantiacus]MDQ0775356.1 DNA-binding IclR family transcriptional regulator [Streptomyces aurantiacus]
MSGTRVPPRSGRPAAGEAVLTRAFRLLRAFEAAGEALSLATLARRSGLPKSSTLRIATQLVAAGALERRDSGDFVIGLRLLEVASLAPRGHGLRAAALPYMQDLQQVTRQHVLLAVRDDTDAVLVERLSALDATPVKYRVGGRLPLDATGVGLALLAHAPESVRAAVIDGPAATVPDAAAGRRVRQLVAAVRAEGVVALTIANPVAGGPAEITTVAAPILDARGHALGAISLVSPSTGESRIGLRLALRTASLAIARATGERPPAT